MLHFNENLFRDKIVDTDGKPKVTVTYPKFKNGVASVKSTRVQQTYSKWLQTIVNANLKKIQIVTNNLNSM